MEALFGCLASTCKREREISKPANNPQAKSCSHFHEEHGTQTLQSQRLPLGWVSDLRSEKRRFLDQHDRTSVLFLMITPWWSCLGPPLRPEHVRTDAHEQAQSGATMVVHAARKRQCEVLRTASRNADYLDSLGFYQEGQRTSRWNRSGYVDVRLRTWRVFSSAGLCGGGKMLCGDA